MGEIDPAFIQATEHRPKLTVVKAGGIPLIDLSILNSHSPEGSTDDLVAISDLVEEIGGACKDWGFFLVTNHGVPLDVRQRVETLAKEFFDLHQLYLIWEEGYGSEIMWYGKIRSICVAAVLMLPNSHPI